MTYLLNQLLWSKNRVLGVLVGIILTLLHISISAAQTISDTSCAGQTSQNNQLKYHYLIDFYSSFALNQFMNNTHDNDKGEFNIYYNATIAGDLYYKKFSYNLRYTTDFGITKHFDSIAIIEVDQFNFNNSLAYQLANSKFAANLSYMTRGQYFNHYLYSVDSSGSTKATPHSSFKSPGYRIISVGLRYAGKGVTVELGLANGMITIMKNQKYFDILDTENLYGLEKGVKKKLDYGLSLTITAMVQKLYKNIFFENYSQARVVKDDLSYLFKYNFDINHAFHYLFLKYFRVSFRIKVIYDYQVQLKPNIINNITLGFYFRNSL
ncbi:MAG: hypothetical protein PHG67_13935 [Bacteroidales bacterium]|jgi:hypothetical protein|nr:hypothetical protein [Bacteroidales bacterium]